MHGKRRIRSKTLASEPCNGKSRNPGKCSSSALRHEFGFVTANGSNTNSALTWRRLVSHSRPHYAPGKSTLVTINMLQLLGMCCYYYHFSLLFRERVYRATSVVLMHAFAMSQSYELTIPPMIYTTLGPTGNRPHRMWAITYNISRPEHRGHFFVRISESRYI